MLSVLLLWNTFAYASPPNPFPGKGKCLNPVSMFNPGGITVRADPVRENLRTITLKATGLRKRVSIALSGLLDQGRNDSPPITRQKTTLQRLKQLFRIPLFLAMLGLGGISPTFAQDVAEVQLMLEEGQVAYILKELPPKAALFYPKSDTASSVT